MRERGFSMIEMMVAMVITLLIMGSVYGLIAGGQNAFRREPELAERQQNIRMAMDLIMRDIANAASGLPPFVQTFTPGLDACAACPMGPDNVRTDELEMITNSESRDTEPICRTIGVFNSDDVRLMRDVTVPGNPNPILPNTLVIPFTANGQWTLRNLVSTTQNGAAVPNTDCTAGSHTMVDLLQASDTTGLNRPFPCVPNTWGNTTHPCELVGLSFANIVKYRIRLDGAGVPMLERWSSDSVGAIEAGTGNPNPAAFQTLARGIENMQVQYLRADGNPGDPPAVPGDWVDAAPVVTLDELRHPGHPGAGHAGRAQRGAEHRRGVAVPDRRGQDPRNAHVRGLAAGHAHEHLRRAGARPAVGMALMTRLCRRITGVGKDDMRASKNESGFALILAILALMLLTFLGLTLVTTTSTELQIATNYRWSQQALYNAEAGMEAAKEMLRGYNWPVIIPAARITTWSGATTPPNPNMPGGGAVAFNTRNDSWGNASRNFENWECDARGNGMGYGVVLDDGGPAGPHQYRSTLLGQNIMGATTLWVRRPTWQNLNGTVKDLSDIEDADANDLLILTSEGIAPFTGGAATLASSASNRAVQVVEVVLRRQTTLAAGPCGTRAGQAGGGAEGAGFGGCDPITGAGVASGMPAGSVTGTGVDDTSVR